MIIKMQGQIKCELFLVVFMLDYFPLLVPSAGIKCRLSKTINIQLTKRLKIVSFIPLLVSLDLAKTRLILDEMCRLYGKFTSYFFSYKWPYCLVT